MGVHRTGVTGTTPTSAGATGVENLATGMMTVAAIDAGMTQGALVLGGASIAIAAGVEMGATRAVAARAAERCVGRSVTIAGWMW